MGALDDLRQQMDELEWEADHHRQRADNYRVDAEMAEDRADRFEGLLSDILLNLNGDLVDVWRKHRKTLNELGYGD
jgi:hypothetical protein